MLETRTVAPACFFEEEPATGLWRRTFVEAVGTCFLTIAMVGSGIAVTDRAKDEPLVASAIVAIAVAGSLVGLIVALGKVSGGHYNPLITLSQWLSGERGVGCTFAYLGGQLAGGLIGATVAGLMFGAFPSDAASPNSFSTTLLVSEAVASAGLLTIVLGCGRSAKWETGPFAVGAWLTAAILATPSTSYANPAVTSRLFMQPARWLCVHPPPQPSSSLSWAECSWRLRSTGLPSPGPLKASR
jgi:glycerol uptake facilitator-like aquaporin